MTQRSGAFIRRKDTLPSSSCYQLPATDYRLMRCAMAYEIKKLTPNLIVSDVERSLAFYCDVLGFAKTATVPEESPYVFATVQSGPVEIFFNARDVAIEEYPVLANMQIGGTLTLYVEVSGLEQIYEELKDRKSTRLNSS